MSSEKKKRKLKNAYLHKSGLKAKNTRLKRIFSHTSAQRAFDKKRLLTQSQVEGNYD